MIRYIVVLLVFSLLSLSCSKKEKIVEVPGPTIYLHDSVKNAWTEEPINSSLGNLFIYNSGVLGKYFSFVTMEGRKYSCDSVDGIFGDISYFPYSGSISFCSLKPHIKNNFCVTNIDDAVTISATMPKSSGLENHFYIALKTFDRNFISVSGNNSIVFENSVITNGSVFIPAFTTNTTVNTIYKFNLTTQPGNSGIPTKIDTLNSIKVEIPVTNNVNQNIYSCGNIDDRAFFFLKGTNSTYVVRRVQKDTSYKVSSECLYSFFKWNGLNFAIGFDTYLVYSSGDNGDTWNQFGVLSEKNPRIINFDNKLLCMAGSHIFDVTLTASELSFREIKTSGIGNKAITSLTRLGKKVFVTTNGGLYSCPYSSFYSYVK